jgi:cell division transport system ATP-binding protein
MIEMMRVSKAYPQNPQALLDISFKVEKGQFIYLLGANGSGKTTLLKLLYAAEKPTQGKIRVDGFELHRIKSREIPYLRRKLGVVFQDLKLLPRLNAFENVALALEIMRLDKREITKKTWEALQLVGMEHKGNCLPGQLSAGEQQRLAIARAIVNSPLVVLADEPTANIGLHIAEKILKIFAEINLRGATLILATHNEFLPALLPRDKIILESGRIIESSLPLMTPERVG